MSKKQNVVSNWTKPLGFQIYWRICIHVRSIWSVIVIVFILLILFVGDVFALMCVYWRSMKPLDKTILFASIAIMFDGRRISPNCMLFNNRNAFKLVFYSEAFSGRGWHYQFQAGVSICVLRYAARVLVRLASVYCSQCSFISMYAYQWQKTD